MNIVVWFSCGAASAVAAKKTLERYGDKHSVRIVNNPVVEEHPDNQRFLKDVEEWLGVKIETSKNTRYPSCSCADVWDDRQFMSGPKGAPCTSELKMMARKQWEMKNHVDIHVMGFVLEEKKRHIDFQDRQKRKLLPVLIADKITKSECYHIIAKAGLELPKIYQLGFPNANCVGCVKATSPTYWNLVREKFPEVFQERAEQSRDIGARLVRHKGKRMFLDELSPDAKGRPLKNLDFECGIFCK